MLHQKLWQKHTWRLKYSPGIMSSCFSPPLAFSKAMTRHQFNSIENSIQAHSVARLRTEYCCANLWYPRYVDTIATCMSYWPSAARRGNRIPLNTIHYYTVWSSPMSIWSFSLSGKHYPKLALQLLQGFLNKVWIISMKGEYSLIRLTEDLVWTKEISVENPSRKLVMRSTSKCQSREELGNVLHVALHGAIAPLPAWPPSSWHLMPMLQHPRLSSADRISLCTLVIKIWVSAKLFVSDPFKSGDFDP